MINTWHEFFEEIATKIYDKYKSVPNSDRAKEFADWINNNIKNTKRFKSNNTGSLNHFDPFSFFSVIIHQTDHGVDNKQQVWDSISSALNVGSLNHPLADTGLTRRSVTGNFFTFDCPLLDFDNLWEMFYIAIEYEKNRNNPTLEQKFVEAFNVAKGIAETNVRSLTMGLFWIRPQYFVPLDNKCYEYAEDKNILHLPKDNNKIDGKKYLELLEEFHGTGGNPVDFSIEAYNYSEANEKDKNKETKGKNNNEKKTDCNPGENGTIMGSISTVAYNKIFYGVPGCGKSYHIEHIVLDEIFQNCNDKKDKNIFRTIFYQDYSHADFVGQYMPKRINGQVEYTFVPKVFTKALEKAYQCPDEPVVLIIEEINRGDAASIFGDIFQLLDRNSDGESEYKIDCDEIVDYLNEKRKKKAYKSSENISQIIDTGKIYLPKNLYLLATMNTCDQNVFALDTAFKRRWRMEEIPNEFNNHELKDKFVPYDFGADEYITWEDFVKVVNKQIVDCSDEFFGDDRQIGCFFVDDTCLLDDPPVKDEDKSRNFAYKVISYLWNDVAKINRTKWFKENIKTLHDVIDGFKRNDEIFNDDLKQALRNNNQQTSDSTDTGKTIGELQENEGIEE